MATLSVQVVVLGGIVPSYATAGAGGDEFVNSGREMIHVKNGGGGSINVTVNSQEACNQGYDHDAVVAVAAGTEKMIGPFPKSRFDDSGGKVQIAYSGVTSVTIAVLQLP